MSAGSWYGRRGKRGLDVLLASIALVVLSPVMLIVAALIRLEDSGPAIFRQRRTGRDGRPFTLLKFRSMAVGSSDRPSSEAAGLRITRVGRVIRRANLDELPQLINIVRGDMSIVGPRPSLPTQDALIAIRAATGVLSCRPGLTGLAQVNAFDRMSAEQKAALDAAYARELSLALDLTIIARTFRYLAKRPPVY